MRGSIADYQFTAGHTHLGIGKALHEVAQTGGVEVLPHVGEEQNFAGGSLNGGIERGRFASMWKVNYDRWRQAGCLLEDFPGTSRGAIEDYDELQQPWRIVQGTKGGEFGGDEALAVNGAV